MELLVFGHAGARVLIFPTSQGRFFQWEDMGMIAALGEHLEQGWLQIFCVDSVDDESWYNKHISPAESAVRHNQYDQYILNLLYDPRVKAGMTVQEVKEVLPDVLADVRAWVRKVNNLAE